MSQENNNFSVTLAFSLIHYYVTDQSRQKYITFNEKCPYSYFTRTYGNCIYLYYKNANITITNKDKRKTMSPEKYHHRLFKNFSKLLKLINASNSAKYNLLVVKKIDGAFFLHVPALESDQDLSYKRIEIVHEENKVGEILFETNMPEPEDLMMAVNWKDIPTIKSANKY